MFVENGHPLGNVKKTRLSNFINLGKHERKTESTSFFYLDLSEIFRNVRFIGNRTTISSSPEWIEVKSTNFSFRDNRKGHNFDLKDPSTLQNLFSMALENQCRISLDQKDDITEVTIEPVENVIQPAQMKIC